MRVIAEQTELAYCSDRYRSANCPHTVMACLTTRVRLYAEPEWQLLKDIRPLIALTLAYF